MVWSRHPLSVVLCLASTLDVAVAASPPARRLLGTVTDASGTPLADVTVTLLDVGGPAPEFAADRSAVNAEGAGSEVQRSRGDLEWTEKTSGSDRDDRLLKELATDDDGSFTYATPLFVGALLVHLERQGYETARVPIPFPLGTSRKTFTLHEAGESPALEPMPAEGGSDGERATAQFDRGVALVKAAEWERARVAFTAAVKIKPDFENAWLNLAIASFQLRDFSGALAAAEALLALKPDHPVATMLASDARAKLAGAAEKPAPGERPEGEENTR